MTFSGGITTRIAPIALLLTVFVASAASAQITAERPVSTPVYAPMTLFGSSAIASDGEQFLAAWIDGIDRYSVFVTRIDSDGTVLDPIGIFVATAATNYPVGVAWNGDSYVLVWTGFNAVVGSTTVMAARIATDGRIVDPPHVIVQGAQVRSQNPIAANGIVSVVLTSGGYVVLDNELRVIQSSPFGSFDATATVNVTGAGEFTLIAYSGNVRLNSSGQYVSVWILAGPVGGAISCHGQNCIRVFGNGTTRLNVAPYDPIAQTTGTHLGLAVADRPFALVAIANGYLLVTSDNTIQRFDMQGQPAGPPIFQSLLPITAVAAASNGRDAAVLRLGRSTQIVTMMTPSGEGQPRALALGANGQQRPAIAGSGSNYLLAWTESDGLYIGRISLEGSVLDDRGRLVTTLTRAPSVTFDGASYVVSASTPNDPGLTTIVRIDPSTGATLAVQTICGKDMRIASNGTTTIAVWVDCVGGVVAAFLDTNGALASIPVTAGTPPAGGSVAHPSLSWNGTLWLVTWEDQYPRPIISDPLFVFELTSLAIRSSRLSASLTPIDTTPMTIAANGGYIESSRAASDGHDFLSVWSDGMAIHERRISAAGVPLDDQQIAHGTLQDLVWDGTAYSLAFAAPNLSYYKPSDLALLRLSPTGQAFTSMLINATPDDERSAALLSLGSGHVIAAYTRFAHESLYGGVERVFVAAPRPARGRTAR